MQHCHQGAKLLKRFVSAAPSEAVCERSPQGAWGLGGAAPRGTEGPGGAAPQDAGSPGATPPAIFGASGGQRPSVS